MKDSILPSLQTDAHVKTKVYSHFCGPLDERFLTSNEIRDLALEGNIAGKHIFCLNLMDPREFRALLYLVAFLRNLFRPLRLRVVPHESVLVRCGIRVDSGEVFIQFGRSGKS